MPSNPLASFDVALVAHRSDDQKQMAEVFAARSRRYRLAQVAQFLALEKILRFFGGRMVASANAVLLA